MPGAKRLPEISTTDRALEGAFPPWRPAARCLRSCQLDEEADMKMLETVKMLTILVLLAVSASVLTALTA